MHYGIIMGLYTCGVVMYRIECTAGFIARRAGWEAYMAQGKAELHVQVSVCLQTPPQVQ